MAAKKKAVKKSAVKKAVARKPARKHTAAVQRRKHDYQFKQVDPAHDELARLQLEELKLSLERKKGLLEMRKMESASQEAQLRASREDLRRAQAACNHRKGGKDKAGIGRGNDSDYAIVKHTYPNMQPSVMCLRCQMDWRPGDTEKRLHTGEVNHTKVSFETAIEWPTDNEPSSATFFLIPVGDSDLAVRVRALQAEIAALKAQGVEVAA